MTKQQAVQSLSKLARFSLDTAKALWKEMKKAFAAFKNYYDAKANNEQAKNQLMAQQTAQQNQLILAQEIQWELFCALNNKKYPYLQPVQAVSDIVVYNHAHYGIALISTNSVPAYGLRQVTAHMNQEIQSLVQTAILYNQAALYPCLMQGLHVVNITVNGVYAILTVAFLQQPQQQQQHNAGTVLGGII